MAFKSDLVTTNRFLNYNLPTQNQNSALNQTSSKLTSTKDLFLVKTELTLITADEESVLIELSNSPSSSAPVFPFFTSSNTSASSYLQNTTFIKPTKLQPKASSYSSTNFLNSTFLNDLRKLAILL